MTTIKNIFDKMDLKTMLILGLIIVILFMRMCDGESDPNKKTIKIDGKKYEVIKHDIDTLIVPVKETIFKKGETIFKEEIIYVDVPSKVDTNLILKDYFAKVVYKDTLKLKDSLGYITITDTITKNSILNRLYNTSINKTTIKETLIVKDLPRNQLYVGGLVGFDRTNIVNFLGPNLTLKTKKDKMFSLGGGLGLNKNLTIQAGMSWKISLRKKQ